jgi:Mn2+/Fe2+ NRAMP family transporter
MQLYIQSAVAEKGVTMEHYSEERTDTYFGAIFGDLISASIIIATGATVFVATGGVGRPIGDAKTAALALVPFLGRYAVAIFAVGLVGASLLAAAVLPLATSYSVCESFGFERGVSHKFREAPIFLGLFTGILGLGALVALLPGLPLIQLILVAQVINGVLLPILLVFILRLVNDQRIMGPYVNSRTQNIIAWGTAILLSLLSTVMILSVLLPAVGIPFLQ